MMFRCIGAGLVCLLIWGGLALANENQMADDAIPTMDTVVVTAGRVAEKEKTLTNHVTVLDRETIQQSPAQDVGELLAEQGFAVRQYPGTQTSIAIRGFRSDTHGNDLTSKVLILLDGRRAGTGNVAKITTKNVERVEVLRGPASVQYGSAAVGGVVNVITRQGSGKPTGFVGGTMGSWRYEEGYLGGQGEINNLDFSAAVSRTTEEDYQTAAGDTYQNTGYDEKKNFSGNVGYHFNENHRLGFIYTSFAVDEAGSPNYLSQNDLNSYTDKSLYSADAIYTGQTTNEWLSWKARFFGGKDKDKDVGMFGIFESISDREGAQAQLSADWDLVSLTGGVDWVNYEIESTSTPLLATYDNPAGFLLAKGQLLDERLILSAGGRYDSYEVEIKEGQGRKEKDNNFTPNVGLAYLLTDRFKVRANYGEAFIIPSAAQLAADYVNFIGPVRGNPNLKPEKSTTWEGGVDFFGSGTFATLTYFHTNFEDKIEGVFLPGGISSWDNIGEATISGVEGEFNIDLGAINEWDFILRPYVRFTYLTKFEDDATGEDLKYTPDLTAATGIVFSTGTDLTATFNVAYISETTVDDFENWDFFVDPEPEVVTLGSSTVASLTVTKTLLSSDRYGKLSFKGDITNLFNTDYAYVKGYPMPGRSFFLGLRYDI